MLFSRRPVCLLATIAFLCRLAATSISTNDWEAYERGEFGLFPQTEYQSVDGVSAPLVHVTHSHETCDSKGLTILSPRGQGNLGNKILFLNHQGELVWSHDEIGTVSDVRVQKYKDHEYITYWVGEDPFMTHGRGYYKMLDGSYSLAFTISAQNNTDGDFHEFSITPDNTALITSYVKTPWDLSSFGIKQGYIWDCVFQEIDIETEDLLFEWRASDQFTFDDMAKNSWEEWAGTDLNPWDWFHLNSVEKDPWGNYLISARFTNAVTYLDGKTGKPIWHLGGENSSFFTPFQPGTTRLTDPHMARWADNYTAITLFQNSGVDLNDESDNHKFSHGMKINLNIEQRVASVDVEIEHPAKLFALPEGSIHMLENGNYFVGYGTASIYSEYSSNGTLLCNTHYSPLHTGAENQLQPGGIQSYRIYKQNWTGNPREPPQIAMIDEVMYVSWNGATEVTSWKLEGEPVTKFGHESWKVVGLVEKEGFETSIPVSESSYALYKLAALDQKGHIIKAWVLHIDGEIWELTHDNHGFPRASSRNLGPMVILVCVALLAVINRRILPKVHIFNAPRKIQLDNV